MLSTELANIADWTLTYAARGKHMPPECAAQLSKVLLDLSHQAQQLERLPIDLAEAVLEPVDA